MEEEEEEEVVVVVVGSLGGVRDDIKDVSQ